MKDLAKKVTLRLVTYHSPVLIIEFDGEEVSSHDFGEFTEDDSMMLKAAELAFVAMGYKPDIQGMYIDMSLMVLHLFRDEG